MSWVRHVQCVNGLPTHVKQKWSGEWHGTCSVFTEWKGNITVCMPPTVHIHMYLGEGGSSLICNQMGHTSTFDDL